MNYSETLEYLYTRLPMFQRIGAAAYKADLSNTLAMDKILGHPHRTFPSVHIAGTNGKGSTSHYLASVLQECGYKVGLYTSPHLKDFRERIKLNGKPIDKRFIVRFVEKHKEEFEKIEPSFFEWTVGLAFEYFKHKKADIVILETGMGGRLDSTNIVTPILSLITNISMDHAQFLGNTLEKIAGEKAGIIKPATPVIISETHPATRKVFKETAKKNGAPILFADSLFSCKNLSTLHGKKPMLQFDLVSENDITAKKWKSELTGLYQKKNLPGVIAAAGLLKTLGWKITKTGLRKGIEKVITNTALPGRWQQLKQSPFVVADIAHNEGGLRETMKQLKSIPGKDLHLVIGFVKDKDISRMLDLLPKRANYYFCSPRLPRALDVISLTEQAGAKGLKGKAYSSVKLACSAAIKAAGKEDLVYIGGSAFVVAEAI